MEARVQIISKEMIIPSPQTPHHLRNFRFAYLDQLINPMYIPLIFFYQPDDSRGLSTSNHVQISHHLKTSLSETLTSFYPLAGRIKDNFSVDCNDAGVEFITARIHANQLIESESNMEELKQYIPLDPTSVESPGETLPLCLVQITFFDCGGIALGLCFSHQVADCASIMAFVDAWAATHSGEAEIPPIKFDLASHFPAKNFPGSGFWKFCMSDEKYITKRFVFDKKKLEVLKKTAGPTPKDPTRVELVSAFIWKNFMEVAKEKRVFAAFHAVNLRARNEALENVFGNCIMSALAFSTSANAASSDQSRNLVSELRRSFRRVGENYIREAQNGDNYLKDLYDMFSLLIKRELEFCSFSSWSRFGMYEIDYGWGKPVWSCTTALPLKNLTVLMRTRCGQGIEAWVNMEKEHLVMLETKIKLISIN